MKVLLLALALGSASAFANDAVEYADLVSRSSITIAQATKVAEQSLSGVSVAAELDSWRGNVVFEVDVLVDNKVFDVFVNAKTGAILLTREDR